MIFCKLRLNLTSQFKKTCDDYFENMKESMCLCVTHVVRQKRFILDIYGNRETRRRRLISMKWISYGMQSPITHTLALFDSCLYLTDDANASFTSHKHTHRSIFMNFHLKYMLSLLLQNTFHIFPFFFLFKNKQKKTYT